MTDGAMRNFMPQTRLLRVGSSPRVPRTSREWQDEAPAERTKRYSTVPCGGAASAEQRRHHLQLGDGSTVWLPTLRRRLRLCVSMTDEDYSKLAAVLCEPTRDL